MLAYEVTAHVKPEVTDRYIEYMRHSHIPDVMGTGCFVEAEMGRGGETRFRQRYLARTSEDLERYLADHAPRLREDFARTFPEGTSLSRETWQQIGHWP